MRWIAEAFGVSNGFGNVDSTSAEGLDVSNGSEQ